MPLPRMYVPGPTFTPLPYGLLSTLNTEIRTPGSPHWMNGVSYDTLCAQSNTTFDECIAVSGTGTAPVGAAPSKTQTASMGHRGATAFTIFSEVDCSPVGFWDNAEAAVGNSLTQSEQWQVENAFWTGLAANQPVVYPHLAAAATVFDDMGYQLQTAATIVTGAVLDVVEGVGRLESVMADCYDGVPVLHMGRELIPAMATNMLLVREGPRYRTPGGSIVVFGAGYRGTSPSGVSTPGSSYVYATGAMFLYRSAPTVFPVRESLDRSENTLKAIAERTYVLGWDCCHYAVNITTGGVVAGTANSAT